MSASLGQNWWRTLCSGVRLESNCCPYHLPAPEYSGKFPDLLEFQFDTPKIWLIEPYLIGWLIHSFNICWLSTCDRHCSGTWRGRVQHWTSIVTIVMEPVSSWRQEGPPPNMLYHIWGWWAPWKKKEVGIKGQERIIKLLSLLGIKHSLCDQWTLNRLEESEVFCLCCKNKIR